LVEDFVSVDVGGNIRRRHIEIIIRQILGKVKQIIFRTLKKFDNGFGLWYTMKKRFERG